MAETLEEIALAECQFMIFGSRLQQPVTRLSTFLHYQVMKRNEKDAIRVLHMLLKLAPSQWKCTPDEEESVIKVLIGATKIFEDVSLHVLVMKCFNSIFMYWEISVVQIEEIDHSILDAYENFQTLRAPGNILDVLNRRVLTTWDTILRSMMTEHVEIDTGRIVSNALEELQNSETSTGVKIIQVDIVAWAGHELDKHHLKMISENSEVLGILAENLKGSSIPIFFTWQLMDKMTSFFETSTQILINIGMTKILMSSLKTLEEDWETRNINLSIMRNIMVLLVKSEKWRDSLTTTDIHEIISTCWTPADTAEKTETLHTTGSILSAFLLVECVSKQEELFKRYVNSVLEEMTNEISVDDYISSAERFEFLKRISVDSKFVGPIIWLLKSIKCRYICVFEYDESGVEEILAAIESGTHSKIVKVMELVEDVRKEYNI